MLKTKGGSSVFLRDSRNAFPDLLHQFYGLPTPRARGCVGNIGLGSKSPTEHKKIFSTKKQ